MGRQLQVLLSVGDEERLLEFLRSKQDIRIFESFADRVGDLEVESLPKPSSGHLHFDVWPVAFPWKPEFAQTVTSPPRWYVVNKNAAPLLEYSRGPLGKLMPGRLYWADRFSGEPDYDRAAFARWVDSIWRWVRRAAKNRAFAGGPAWCFPEAAACLPLEAQRDGK
ncbi:MAG TPA: hypothetical protein VGQ57_17035 [Polyangiaceae bacterium]|jgi:hypothetical protein|nr:hypothetical protein [Polyangiaceae bacterium]